MLETIIVSLGFLFLGYIFGSKIYQYLLDPDIIKKELERGHRKIMERSRVDQRYLFEKYKSGLEDYHNYREKISSSPKGLPSTAMLGELRFLEMFDYYDGPRIFTCVNTCGEVFLALSVEDDVKNSKERWFYLKLSIERLKHLKNDNKDLYQAFKEAESGFVIEISIDASGHREALISADLIKDAELPLPGEKIGSKPEIVDSETFFKNKSDVRSVN